MVMLLDEILKKTNTFLLFYNQYINLILKSDSKLQIYNMKI